MKDQYQIQKKKNGVNLPWVNIKKRVAKRKSVKRSPVKRLSKSVSVSGSKNLNQAFDLSKLKHSSLHFASDDLIKHLRMKQNTQYILRLTTTKDLFHMRYSTLNNDFLSLMKSPDIGTLGHMGLSGFKKLLFNRVCAINNVLVPAYNRRTHSINHTNTVLNQLRKLSRTFGYISENTLGFWLASLLSVCYDVTGKHDLLTAKLQFKNDVKTEFLAVQTKYANGKTQSKHKLNNKQALNTSKKSCALLINAIETRTDHLFWRAHMCKSVYHAKQTVNHRKFKFVKLNKQTALNPVIKYINKTNYFQITGLCSWISVGGALRSP